VTLRIATRRSKLALAQSHWVKARLEALHPGLTVELREYVTRGDQIQNVPLSQVGGKGLFTKEIEDALLAREADLAVHSLKDLPTALPPGLTLGAIPPREDPRDALVLPQSNSTAGIELQSLPPGARIGSSSLRRMAQVLNARPDLRVESVRGNVDTRLRKLDEGQYDALILAAAGLRRLALESRISTLLSPEASTPAPGQGALGLEIREDDPEIQSIVGTLNHAETEACVTAERALMDTVGGGCSVPLGAYARRDGDRLHLIAVLASPTGTPLIREHGSGAVADPLTLGRQVAERLFAAGARELLDGL
jgi:hydroxymethylbilane synthase